MQQAFKGFSLVETVVVVSIVVLISGTLAGIIQYFYRSNAYVLQEGTAVQSARTGVATAMQNLREASYGDDGSYPIGTAATSSISFYANVSSLGSVEKIKYYLDKKTLYRTVTYSTGNPPAYPAAVTSSTSVATFVQNDASLPVFQYYDSTGTILTYPINISLIATITTTLNVDVDTNRSPTPYTLIGSATLRNLQHP